MMSTSLGAGKMKCTLGVLLVCCSLIAAGSVAKGAVLYDVNFSAPLHSVGMAPATGGMAAPSSIVEMPVVESMFGAVASQSLEIRPPTNTRRANAKEGIVFRVSTSAQRYLVEY